RRRHTRFDCDWSSDVCSSDLESADTGAGGVELCGSGGCLAPGEVWRALLEERRDPFVIVLGEAQTAHLVALQVQLLVEGATATRSEERRVGKEGWSRVGS